MVSETAIELPTDRGGVRVGLHPVHQAWAAIVLVGGAGGGMHGPAGIYPELAVRLRAEGVTAARVDYRVPNNLDECVHDVLAVIEMLARQGVERIVLVGWSFGGAVVIAAGALSDAVIGVATVASQTYGTDAIGRLSPRSLLLLHGAADPILPASLSQHLYARAGEPKELVLYPGDNHGLSRHRAAVLTKLVDWSQAVLAGPAG